MSEEETNYYDDVQLDPTGLKYRLEGDDVIKSVIDCVRGGSYKDKKGVVKWHEAFRLMNEEGVSRIELFLRGGVNKINHLTKYKNEGRILLQIKSLMRAFTIELVMNLKRWAPNARVEVMGDREVIINPNLEKVRNKHIVLQVVENALLQSMLRGGEGFEAELTGKSWNVVESVGRQQEEERRRGGFRFGGLFGGRRDEE